GEHPLSDGHVGRRHVPLVPRPRLNLVLYHGVLAPNALWRRAVVARAEPEAGTVEPCPSPTPADDQREDATGRRARPKYRAWADLMRRAFDHQIDCSPPRRGDRSRPDHASVPPAVRAGDRLRRSSAALGW